MKKKILLGLGATTSVVAPIAAVVACGSSSEGSNETQNDANDKVWKFLSNIKASNVNASVSSDFKPLDKSTANSMGITLPEIGEFKVTYKVEVKNRVIIKVSLNEASASHIFGEKLQTYITDTSTNKNDKEIANSITESDINEWLKKHVDLTKVASKAKDAKTWSTNKFSKNNIEFEITLYPDQITAKDNEGKWEWKAAFRNNNTGYISKSGTLKGFKTLSDQEKISSIQKDLGSTTETIDKSSEYFGTGQLDATNKNNLINYSKTYTIHNAYGITPTINVTKTDGQAIVTTTYTLNGKSATKTTTITIMKDADNNKNIGNAAKQNAVNALRDKIVTKNSHQKPYITVKDLVVGDVVPAMTDQPLTPIGNKALLDTFQISGISPTQDVKYTYSMDEINVNNQKESDIHTLTIKVTKDGKSAEKSFKFRIQNNLRDGIALQLIKKITVDPAGVVINKNQIGVNRAYIKTVAEGAIYGLIIPADVMKRFTENESLAVYFVNGQQTPSQKGAGNKTEVSLNLEALKLGTEDIGPQTLVKKVLMQYRD